MEHGSHEHEQLISLSEAHWKSTAPDATEKDKADFRRLLYAGSGILEDVVQVAPTLESNSEVDTELDHQKDELSGRAKAKAFANFHRTNRRITVDLTGATQKYIDGRKDILG